MATVVTETRERGRSGSINAKWQRNFTRTFHVLFDSATAGANAAIEAVGILPGDRYVTSTESYPYSFAQSISAQIVDQDGRGWDVTVNYSGEYDPGQFPEDPTLWAVQVHWSGSQFQETADRDGDGSPILNSAGVPFNPGLQKDDSRPLLTLVRNERTFDEKLAARFRDKTNLDDFWGYSPRCAKCKPIQASRTLDKKIGWYWVVTYQFEFNEDKWTRKVLDAGTMQLNADGDKLIPITRNSALVSEPVPLDGSGRPLDVGGEPVYLEFDVEEGVNFSDLNLNQVYQDIINYQTPTP